MTTPLLVLNYSYPLTPAQLAQVAAICGVSPEVRDLAAQIERFHPLAEVACALADAVGFSPEDWQTTPLLLNPPALASLALALIAELHGRCGGFPALINVRPVADSLPTRYEVAEVLNLQSLREAARRRR